MSISYIPTVLLLIVTAAVAQPAEISDIDDWVEEVAELIYDGYLVERYISYTHPTIPAIGMPYNYITGWFDQYTNEAMLPDIEEIPFLIENFYEHAGYAAEEAYYYMPKGDMVCCVSTLYDGFGMDIDYMDTFYFVNGDPVFYISGTGETFETMDEEAMHLAQQRLANAETLWNLFMNLHVPAPCVFRERWGEYW